MTTLTSNDGLPTGRRVDITLEAVATLEHMLRAALDQIPDDDPEIAPTRRLLRTAIDLSGIATWALGDDLATPEGLATTLDQLSGKQAAPVDVGPARKARP
jgi:hypothetical protein